LRLGSWNPELQFNKCTEVDLSPTMQTLKDKFLSNIAGFRCAVCVTVEGPGLAEPEQVFGELDVFKTKYRLDMFFGEDAELDDGEMEESVTRLRGRDFDNAEVHTFHTDRFGKSLSIEEYFKSEAKKGTCSTVDVIKVQGDLRTLDLFQIADALQQAHDAILDIPNADTSKVTECDKVIKGDEERFVANYGDGGLRFVYHVDAATGITFRIDQETELDLCEMMQEGARLSEEREETSGTAPAGFRIYATFDDVVTCKLDPSRFVNPNRQYSSAQCGTSMEESGTANAESALAVKKSEEIDDAILIPHDEFWAEFLLEGAPHKDKFPSPKKQTAPKESSSSLDRSNSNSNK